MFTENGTKQRKVGKHPPCLCRGVRVRTCWWVQKDSMNSDKRWSRARSLQSGVSESKTRPTLKRRAIWLGTWYEHGAALNKVATEWSTKSSATSIFGLATVARATNHFHLRNTVARATTNGLPCCLAITHGAQQHSRMFLLCAGCAWQTQRLHNRDERRHCNQ